MSAKLLRSLADDNPDLQCMTGIYQLSDGQYLAVGGRITPKSLPPVRPEAPDFSSSDSRSQVPQGYYTRRDVDDKQTISVESQRASYSSDCSSSFSSLGPSQMHQVEVPTLGRIILPVASSRKPSKNWSGSHFRGAFEDSKRDPLGSFRQEKPVHGPAERKESLRVLAKLREAPAYFDEGSEVSRLSYETAYLAPRLSYDGREPGKLLSESREKLKDLPRLSLDSRECAILGSNSTLKKSRQLISQSSGTPNRPPSVVAKLMGLEALPDPVRAIGTSDSTRRPKIETESPSWKLHDLATKTASGSRFPIELAPWKQQKRGNGESQKLSSSKPVKVPARQAEPCSSVYDEIERRLEDLESKESGKDLRALKQILEAMRVKGFLETEREECPTNSGYHEKYEVKYMSTNQNLKSAKNCGQQSSDPFSSMEQEPDYLRNTEPTIVIMKPARLVGRDGTGAEPRNSRVVDNSYGGKLKEQSPKISRNDSLGYIDKRSNAQGDLISKERIVIPVKSSGSVSPRLQRRRLESEKQDWSTRQFRERKSTSDEKFGSDFPKVSSTLEITTFRDSKTRNKINRQTLSLKSSRHSNTGLVQRTRRLNQEDGLPVEEGISVLVQHSSPVSVLDVSEFRDDSPTSVHQTRNSLGEYSDQEHENRHEAESSLEINRKKLQNVDRLVQKLKRLNSTHEENTDYIALLCENPNSDQRYISEILVASGLLLRDLNSGLSTFQLHPSGHPISPDLFLVLEQRKTRNNLVSEKDKSHRRLIFDAVNEILARKFADSKEIVRCKLVEETLTAQKLLKGLCSEIELMDTKLKKPRSGSEGEGDDGRLRSILWEDAMRGEDKYWTGSHGDTYDMATYLEEMIFEELVDEIEIS